jgi:uncharacterized protein
MPTVEIEPQPRDPCWPRYSHRAFPSSRFLPGRSPHPRRNPQGHSYGQAAPDPVPLLPDQWRQMDDYLYAVDLYNFAYWWECHELLEGFWHAAGRKTEQGNFFRALIQLAAANLKRFVGYRQAADNLMLRAITRLEQVPSLYMGVDVASLMSELRAHRCGLAPLIRLNR